MDAETKGKVLARLKRIAGQLEGIQRMVEDDRYCVDILMQIAAVRAACTKAGRVMLESHVETCVVPALTQGSAKERSTKVGELMDVFGRYC